MTRLRSVWLAVSAVTAFVAASPAPGAAAQQPITISSGPYELAEEDDGHTLAIDIANGGPDTVDVRLEPAASDPGCTITADPERVEGNRSKSVKFTLPEACGVDAETDLSLQFVATQNGQAILAIPLEATPAPEQSSDFGALWWFVGAGVLASLCVWLVYDLWRRYYEAKPTTKSALPGIKSDWNFKDSWGSNVGLAGAIFTGVLGTSDLLEKIFGKGNESAVPVVVVVAALAAGLIGAAPLMLAMLRTSADKAPPGDEGLPSAGQPPPPPPESVTSKIAGQQSPDEARKGPVKKELHSVAGVLWASIIVLGANLGQVAAIWWVLDTKNIGSAGAVRFLAGAAAIALLVYAIVTIPQTLTGGFVPVKPEAEPDAIRAAKLVAEALLAGTGAKSEVERKRLVDALEVAYPSGGTSTGDTRRDYAAMF